MTRLGLRPRLVVALAVALAAIPAVVRGQEPSSGGLPAWLAAVDSGLARVEALAASGDADEASALALRVYLDQVERIEGFYGPGAFHAAEGLSDRVTDLEAGFHELIAATEGSEIAQLAAAVRTRVAPVLDAARSAGVPLVPEAPEWTTAPAEAVDGVARTDEIAPIVEELEAAQAAYAAGDAATALATVEQAYLERFEVLEPLIPTARVRAVESLIHLRLRPALARGADPEQVNQDFRALRAELLAIDAELSGGTGFGFAAFNSFAIVLREGLEAVLLIAAILAYLGAIGAERKHSRWIYTGAGVGIVASFGTWILAATLIPVTGARRELLEGVTALIAVAVLLYVSHWLFQKTYIHDWKEYLREKVGRAVTSGSVLAMAGLAFAAVYREGFETVLFYQALLFDAPPGAVFAGFVPGMIIVLGIGFGIIRLGLRLPLRKLFAMTNAILLYLAFVFLGKGLYNLQEGGAYSPLPLPWLPDSGALQQVFGLYPVAQTVLAQLTLLGLLLTTWIVHRRRMALRSVTVPATAGGVRQGNPVGAGKGNPTEQGRGSVT